MALRCTECATLAQEDVLFCANCQGLLAFELDAQGLAAQLHEILRQRRTSNRLIDASGVWRYREILPQLAEDAITTLRENAVPIYPAVHGADYAAAQRVGYLHLGMNPTGSFKDAGMTVAISHAKARGARVAVCASTGNTAASMAAYAARAGMHAVVLVPAVGVSSAKIAQTLDYGAKVLAIDGDFDRALEMVRTLDPIATAIVNSVNPYRIEGQKCAAFQLLEQRDWHVPDWLVVPGGNLGNTSAFGKGFREALQLGLIDRLPRIAVVQAAGAAPFVPVVHTGEELVPVQAKTNATAIKIGAPASWRKALYEVRTLQGTALTVTDAEIADARAVIGRDGVGCEPASAASLAGLKLLRSRGEIKEHEDVVLVLTGHVLKDGAYASEYHESSAFYANRPSSQRSAEEVASFIRRLAAAD